MVGRRVSHIAALVALEEEAKSKAEADPALAWCARGEAKSQQAMGRLMSPTWAHSVLAFAHSAARAYPTAHTHY